MRTTKSGSHSISHSTAITPSHEYSKSLNYLVGVAGFEPAASSSRTRRARCLRPTRRDVVNLSTRRGRLRGGLLVPRPRYRRDARREHGPGMVPRPVRRTQILPGMAVAVSADPATRPVPPPGLPGPLASLSDFGSQIGSRSCRERSCQGHLELAHPPRGTSWVRTLPGSLTL